MPFPFFPFFLVFIMALTDYDSFLTRNQMIERALRIIGALYHGNSATASQQDTAVKALNSMVKSWQNLHTFLWTEVLHEVDTVVGNVSYSLTALDPPIVWVDKGYREDTDQDTLIEQITFSEYQDIPKKDDDGSVCQFAVSGNGATLYVYPRPIAIYKIKLFAITRLKDWDQAAGTADFLAQWQEALVWGLAAKLAPEYGVSGRELREFRESASYEFNLARRNDRGRNDGNFVKGCY